MLFNNFSFKQTFKNSNCWTDYSSCSQQIFVEFSLTLPTATTTTKNQGEFVANKSTEKNSKAPHTSGNLGIITLSSMQLDDSILMINSQSTLIVNEVASNSLTIKNELQQVSEQDGLQRLSAGIINSI